MPFDDPRDFLEHLEERRELIRITDEVDPKFDAGVCNPIPNRRVDTAPCKEVILMGDEVDLGRLPIPIYAEKDGGAFITHGVQISKDPETGTKNTSIYRMHFHGQRELSLHAESYTHLYQQYAKADARDLPLEVAVVLGCDPAIMLATQVGAAYGVDEMEIAGGLRGKSVDVVKCETVDLDVPATSEIVIEGRLLPTRRES